MLYVLNTMIMSRKKRIKYYDWNVLMLWCSKCWQVLPSDSFWRWSKGPDWFKYECKVCRKNDYNINKNEILLKRKEYYSKVSETKKEYQKKYYYKNSDYIKEQHKQYKNKNIDKIKACRDIYYQTNRERIKTNNIDYSIKKDIELWFWWRKFHDKARGYIHRHGLSPWKCQVCGKEGKVMAHHPSYGNFDERKNVVFVCSACHQNIHHWSVDCPEPIDLILLRKTKCQNKKKKKAITKNGSGI